MIVTPQIIFSLLMLLVAVACCAAIAATPSPFTAMLFPSKSALPRCQLIVDVIFLLLNHICI